MLDIKDFIAYIRKAGLQRSNRFVLSFNVPDKVLETFNNASQNSVGTSISKILSLMAVDVNTPGQNIRSTEQRVGVPRKVAEGRNTGELNITFRCSGDMIERKLFDAWLATIFRDNKTVAFYDDYVCPNLDIFTKDVNGQQTYQVSLEEAYPVTLTELPLNVEQNDNYLMFQVTFNYRRLNNGQMEQASREDIPEYAENSSTGQITSASLPTPPSTNNLPLFLIDVYKNIDRVKQAIEMGNLNKEMGQKLILNIIRDINASGIDSGVTNQALNYANDLIYILGRK